MKIEICCYEEFHFSSQWFYTSPHQLAWFLPHRQKVFLLSGRGFCAKELSLKTF